MNKVFLVIYSKKLKRSFTKYFETEFEKDKYRRRIPHIKDYILIEDSSDINYGNIEDIEFGEFKFDSQI
nr:MAG TPA: hypothetical protein [Caudoviricetes sp.]